jgi:hypothetical protein
MRVRLPINLQFKVKRCNFSFPPKGERAAVAFFAFSGPMPGRFAMRTVRCGTY